MVYLEENAPQPCIQRAVGEGRVENLGCFARSGFPGYIDRIVKVTSKHKKVWYVAMTNHWRVSNPIPVVVRSPLWKHWMGNSGVYNEPSLHNGDHPEKYKELQDEANRKTTERS